jgi:hypothetical protein
VTRESYKSANRAEALRRAEARKASDAFTMPLALRRADLEDAPQAPTPKQKPASAARKANASRAYGPINADGSQRSPFAFMNEKPKRAKQARSREKGHAYERVVADKLRRVYPDARRGIGQARQGGEVPDVEGTPFWVEAKNRKVLNVHDAFAQAVLASTISDNAVLRGAYALVVTRKHGSTLDLATMNLDVLLDLLAELEAHRIGMKDHRER